MDNQAASHHAARSSRPLDPEFDSRRSPVALRVLADSVLASFVAIERLTERLQAIAAVSRHLSIAVDGTDAKRDWLCDYLLDILDGSAGKLLIQSAPVRSSKVIPRCPLLAPERGCCPLSGAALMVPPESAWFPARIELTDYLTGSATVDQNRLGVAVDDIVDAAEACFDTSRWPTPAMQQDAWMNRRLAASIAGYAELRERHAFGMSALHQITGWVSARLQARSMWHAAMRRPAPAILAADPTFGMPQGRFRDEWRRRWRGAVESTAVRHRNLLALEVDRLVYREADTGRLNTELLPLLAHADVIATACTLPMGPDEQRLFGCRLQSSLQQRHALDQIAKRI